nr:hypothetical protein [Tanacetum cinerariifolium]
MKRTLKEDPAYYHADRGNNDDDKSSNDDGDDDDVEKDEEDKEEEEHLAPVDPSDKIVASESNKNPRNFTRKLYERVSKTCSWWYPKFTPSGYNWKPKSGKQNVNSNVSIPLGNASRSANVMDTMTSRRF